MTDTTTNTEAGAAPQVAPTASQAVTAPFPEAHRNLIQELLADAHALVAKIEATSVVTEASTLLEKAKSDVVSAAESIFAHFVSLEAKAQTDAATVETDVKTDAAKVETAIQGTEAPPASAAQASTDAPPLPKPGEVVTIGADEDMIAATDAAAPPAAPTA